MQPPYLESWYRLHLAGVRLDLSSSGVSSYTFGELRDLAGIDGAQLDRVAMDDSESLGAPDLRQAIADRYTGGDAARVMATHGSSEAIALALTAVIRPDSTIAIVEPIYHSLRHFADTLAAKIVPLPLSLFESGTPDPAELESRLAGGVDAVVVNFPHNPTGIHLSDEGLRILQDAVSAAGARLVWDAAFGELVHRGATGQPWRDRQDCVAFGTFSKAFGLPGLRVGWCIAPPDVLERTHAMHDSTTLFLSPLVELIAAAAMRAADSLIEPRLERARANLDRLVSWSAERPELVTLRVPDGGVCCFPGFPTVADTEAFCLDLLASTGLLLIPGEAFGRPGSVRLGFGGPAEEFAEGLDILATALGRWAD
ncbi:MAG: capreomycidine synthase [Actinocatenispora sp.]